MFYLRGVAYFVLILFVIIDKSLLDGGGAHLKILTLGEAPFRGNTAFEVSEW